MRKNILSKNLVRSILAAVFSLNVVPSITSAAIAPDVSSANVSVDVQNGVEVIKINEANSSGLSHNVFTQFDVNKEGAVFNNSVNGANSQLAGMIAGNSNFVNGIAAQTILNEVVSSNPSSLNGIMEVAGQKANLIIANQKGIVGNGFGFINTDRAILTTGNPVINENGVLTGFSVSEGSIITNGVVNAKDVSSLELLGKSVAINSKINANDFKVIAGSSDVTYTDLAYQNTSTTSTTGYAIDISNYGGMHANNIYLVSTDSGLGVRNNAEINSINNLNITSNGDIQNNASMYSQGNIVLESNDSIENTQKDMLQIAAAGNVDLTSQDLINQGKIYSGYNEDGTWKNTGNIKLDFHNRAADLTGEISAAGTINIVSDYDVTNNGFIYSGAGSSINLGVTGAFVNNSSLVSYGNVGIDAGNVTNNGELIAGYTSADEGFANNNGDISIKANSTFLNNSSILANGNIDINSELHLINTGDIYSRKDITLGSSSGDVYSYNFTDDEIEKNPFIGARGSIDVEGNHIHLMGDVLSASVQNGESGYITVNEPEHHLKLNAAGTVTVEGTLGSYIGNIEITGNDIGVMNSDIFSNHYSNSNLALTAVVLDGKNQVLVTNSDVLSDGGYKLNSNSGIVQVSNSYFANEGNNFGSFFGGSMVKFNGGIYTSKGKMMLNAPRIENLGAILFSDNQINAFATGITAPYIKNTGTLYSKDSVSMYVPAPGYFDNTNGFIVGSKWVQLTGSPTLSNNDAGMIASDVSIQIYATNAAVSYPMVAAPTVLINGRGQGTLDRWVAYLDENGIIHYALTGLTTLPSPLYSILANVSDDLYMLYKGDFTDPKNLTNYENIQINNVLEAIPNEKISKIAQVAYKMKKALYYRGYLLSPGQYFGSFDAATGGREFTGVDANKFYEDITYDWTKTLDESGNELIVDGTIVRTSADGTVTATITQADGQSIVYFTSSNQSFNPFNNTQIIRFNN